jgi:hypothetical protein
MDKTKPENQIVCWHEQECSNDTNMDSDVRLPAYCISRVSVRAYKKYAADITATAA